MPAAGNLLQDRQTLSPVLHGAAPRLCFAVPAAKTMLDASTLHAHILNENRRKQSCLASCKAVGLASRNSFCKSDTGSSSNAASGRKVSVLSGTAAT